MAGEREQAQATQRVKVGVVGLAIVILLITLASAVMRTVTREAPVTAIGAPQADVVANMVADNVQASAGEPVAEIGVVSPPGNAQAPAASSRR